METFSAGGVLDSVAVVDNRAIRQADVLDLITVVSERPCSSVDAGMEIALSSE
jgi:hypothetical protein